MKANYEYPLELDWTTDEKKLRLLHFYRWWKKHMNTV